jgi:hypothetical protein
MIPCAMDVDPIDEMNVEMNAGFERHHALIADGSSSENTSSEYEALSATTRPPHPLAVLKLWCETMTRWGLQQTVGLDDVKNDETSRGIHVRCEGCSDDRCRSGIACVTEVGSLDSNWARIFGDWGSTQYQNKAMRKLVHLLVRNDGVSLPSVVDDLNSSSLTMRGNQPSTSDPQRTIWEVFIGRLTDIWEIMGVSDASNHRLCIVRFFLKFAETMWPQYWVDKLQATYLVDLQTAWTGFTIHPAVATAVNPVSDMEPVIDMVDTPGDDDTEVDEVLCESRRIGGEWRRIGCTHQLAPSTVSQCLVGHSYE